MSHGALFILPFAPTEVPLGDKGRTEAGMGFNPRHTF